jgi:uncharacterized membrane protein YesL
MSLVLSYSEVWVRGDDSGLSLLLLLLLLRLYISAVSEWMLRTILGALLLFVVCCLLVVVATFYSLQTCSIFPLKTC